MRRSSASGRDPTVTLAASRPGFVATTSGATPSGTTRSSAGSAPDAAAGETGSSSPTATLRRSRQTSMARQPQGRCKRRSVMTPSRGCGLSAAPCVLRQGRLGSEQAEQRLEPALIASRRGVVGRSTGRASLIAIASSSQQPGVGFISTRSSTVAANAPPPKSTGRGAGHHLCVGASSAIMKSRAHKAQSPEARLEKHRPIDLAERKAMRAQAGEGRLLAGAPPRQSRSSVARTRTRATKARRPRRGRPHSHRNSRPNRAAAHDACVPLQPGAATEDEQLASSSAARVPTARLPTNALARPSSSAAQQSLRLLEYLAKRS